MSQKEVKCVMCKDFKAEFKPKWYPGGSYPFYDKKTHWSNWVIFQVCPKCFKKRKDKKQCKRCERKEKLCKPLKVNDEKNEYYCSWCCLVDLGTCFFCGTRDITILSFKDALSYAEWYITQSCQKCQDKIFN